MDIHSPTYVNHILFLFMHVFNYMYHLWFETALGPETLFLGHGGEPGLCSGAELPSALQRRERHREEHQVPPT